MADPVTLAIIGASVGGAAQLGQTMANYQQGRAEADVLNNQARAVGAQTVQAEEAHRRDAREFLAKQTVAIGQAGIGYGGSAGDLQTQSAIDAELDALNIRYEGLTRMQGLKTEAKLKKKANTAALYLGSAAAIGNTMAGIGNAKVAQKELAV